MTAVLPCPSGKVRHASRAAAKAAATAVGTRRTHTRPRVYACDQCTGFHMTSAPKVRLPSGRRGRPPEPPKVASRAELDAWFAAHTTVNPPAQSAETGELR